MAGTTEILDLNGLNAAGYGRIGVYINLGFEPYPENYNPLPDSAFDSYTPDAGFTLNTGLRTPLFTGPFESSPLQADGNYTYITDQSGYTWLYNTFNYMAINPFNPEDYQPGITRYSAALLGPALPGHLQVVVNDKNQPQTFKAKDESGNPIQHYFATDSIGNQFILGSIDTAYAADPLTAFNAAVLPAGWTKEVKTLSEDFTIYPGYGDGNRCNYNQFRDNITNNFFQFGFSPTGIGIASGIPGLALAGGNNDDLLKGSALDEVIYGARGADQLFGLGGNDELWGDDGDDVLTGGRGSDRLAGGTGLNTFRSSVDGFVDTTIIRTDGTGGSGSADQVDIIEAIDGFDRINLEGVSSAQLSFGYVNHASGLGQTYSGFGLYAEGVLQAVYTGHNLSIRHLRAITEGVAAG